MFDSPVVPYASVLISSFDYYSAPSWRCYLAMLLRVVENGAFFTEQKTFNASPVQTCEWYEMRFERTKTMALTDASLNIGRTV
jgi:hypothetical protein